MLGTIGTVAGMLAPNGCDPRRQRSGFCRGSGLGRSSGKGEAATRRGGGRVDFACATSRKQRSRTRSGATCCTVERCFAPRCTVERSTVAKPPKCNSATGLLQRLSGCVQFVVGSARLSDFLKIVVDPGGSVDPGQRQGPRAHACTSSGALTLRRLTGRLTG